MIDIDGLIIEQRDGVQYIVGRTQDEDQVDEDDCDEGGPVLDEKT